jgi:integrase
MNPPNFSVLVEDYLTMRRSLGFDVERMRWLLRDFARFIGSVEHHGPITVDLAAQWALSSRSSDPARAERRLWAVRQFARYLAGFDPDTEIPPAGLFGRIARRNQPHIYSEAEITALLQECRRLRPRDGLRPRTYVALFSLLASTGLWLSEACHLRRGDVDLRKGLLTVREGKFRKSRLVPLHPTTVQALLRYRS